MDILITFTIASILGVLSIAGVMLWVTNKAGNVAITSYFKAAEYILEHHKPPPSWRNRGGNGKEAILKRMDDLILFFENSTFFEDEHARTVLLNQLRDERTEWAENWDAIS